MHEILLYGLVYSQQVRDLGVADGLTDLELRKGLEEARGQDVTLRINSKGGSADSAFAMNTLLTEYSGKTTAKVDAMSASAATIAMFGCDKIEIAQNAAVMVHKANIDLWGQFNTDDLRDITTSLQNYDKRIAGMYSNRLGGTTEEWLDRLKGDTYYTAQEAVDAGFADSISKVVSVRMDFDPKLCHDPPKWLLKRYGQYKDILMPVDQDDLANNVRQMLAADEVNAILEYGLTLPSEL
jgi:ATP-dependent protease ClpP protease subunit